MKQTEQQYHPLGEIGNKDRVARVSVGIAALIALLHLAITTGVAYPYLSILMSLIVLSGIAGWDPLYAVVHYIERKLENVTVFGRKPFHHAHS